MTPAVSSLHEEKEEEELPGTVHYTVLLGQSRVTAHCTRLPTWGGPGLTGLGSCVWSGRGFLFLPRWVMVQMSRKETSANRTRRVAEMGTRRQHQTAGSGHRVHHICSGQASARTTTQRLADGICICAQLSHTPIRQTTPRPRTDIPRVRVGPPLSGLSSTLTHGYPTIPHRRLFPLRLMELI